MTRFPKPHLNILDTYLNDAARNLPSAPSGDEVDIPAQTSFQVAAINELLVECEAHELKWVPEGIRAKFRTERGAMKFRLTFKESDLNPA